MLRSLEVQVHIATSLWYHQRRRKPRCLAGRNGTRLREPGESILQHPLSPKGPFCFVPLLCSGVGGSQEIT